MTNDLYGWFDAPDQIDPTFEPPRDAPCPYCGFPVTADDVRTHSFMPSRAPKRCFFYRTHRTCDEQAGEGGHRALFDAVVHRIIADGELR